MARNVLFLYIILIFIFAGGLSTRCEAKNKLVAHSFAADTIAYTGTQLCAGGSLVLSINNVPNFSQVQWFYNGQPIANSNAASLTVTQTGSYSAQVNSNGIVTNYNPVAITAGTKPTASFTYATSGKCATAPVKFTSTTPGNNLKYFWDFGDPNSGKNDTSALANPTHTFIGNHGDGVQTYQVKLIVTTAGGCVSDEYTIPITLNQTPSTSLKGVNSAFFNGLPYFVSCTNTPTNFTFTNNSSTTNTNYLIRWGDGSPDFKSTNFTTVDHVFQPGIYTMFFSVTGLNGCTNTQTYYAFVGTSPNALTVKPANNSICTTQPLILNVTGLTKTNNGTIYKVTYSDGEVKTYNKGFDTLMHYFKTSSYNKTAVTTTGTYNNAYTAVIQAANPCGNVKVNAGPVYVSDSQTDNFTITPATPVFVNSTKTLLYADTLGYTVQNDGTAYRTKLVWKITPANGVTPNTDFGNDNNSNDPQQWTAGTTTPSVTFTQPGNYTATLKIGSISCGVGSTSQTFCVDNLPAASYTITSNEVCTGTTLQFNNTSPQSVCGITHNSWTVSYSSGTSCGTAKFTFVNSTDTNSFSPQILFTNPGLYTVQLKTNNGDPATSSVYSQVINVLAPPAIKVNADSLCFNESLKPKFSITNCYTAPILSYQWSFPGGIPSSSTSATPPQINYATAGTYKIKLVVTTKCGIIADSANVVVNPLPVVQPQVSKTYCNGSNTDAVIFTGATANTVFKWTNDNPSIGLPASGIGNIPSFVISNNDNTKSKVANIQATPYLGNCSGEPIQFTLTVLPYLSPPLVTSPITYNLNQRADSLSARITPGNTINWYSDAALQNKLPSAPIPSTKVVQAVNYYVTQSNVLGCESSASVITVAVIPTLTIPNAFTPNGDGVNDIWNIRGSDFGPMIWLQVFNRYGSLLYNEKNHSVKWDGTYNNKMVPTGVYYYILKYDNRTFSGNVTVIY